MERKERFQWAVRPAALKENTVSGKRYRFTVLTSWLIRMEYDPHGIFEDRASQSVFFRDFPKSDYIYEISDGTVRIETKYLVLTYRENEEFSAGTLSVKLKEEPASVWRYSEDFEDLGGTVKTLDCINGAVPLKRGVCSRNGFSVIDDTERMILEEDGWVGIRNPDTVDCYFFGYGYDYIGCIQDYYRLTGIPPMLPAYALGNWWSRYHKYTQQEYIDLMKRFRQEDVPFSVGVIDMDWHVTKIPEELKGDVPELETGWTGYSWNKEMFPNYKAFLKFLAENNLKATLNLHPAQGVGRHEDMYEQMEKAMGVDPSEGKRIPFDILSKKFMENYFDIVHHPYEEDGVGFWWMDWQQGTDYWWIHEANTEGKLQDKREVLDPLWMLNHLHILDISRSGKRPMFFSRYSGPGSHRYPVGFSGDTIVTWDSLAFQPYFTATASNIGYSWWSNDIGGHMGGHRDDELTARWVQFGVLSPINRLHSTDCEFQRKEPWCYGWEYEAVLKKWLRLRQELFPYIYAMNYRTHTELLPMMQPMYYSHPKYGAAYEVPTQYWFGSELIVAPITEKRDAVDRLGKADAWLPQGDWFDFFHGAHYVSDKGRKMKLYRSIEEYPVFAKAGGIVPMMVRTPHDNRMINSDKMEVVIFPGADNIFTLYEDEGEYNRFEQGSFAKTEMRICWGEQAEFTISPAAGETVLIPQERQWTLKLRGFHKDIEVSVTLNGKQVNSGAIYDSFTNTMSVTVGAKVTDEIRAKITGKMLVHDNSDVYDRCFDILQHSQLEISRKESLMRNVMTPRPTLHEQILYFCCDAADEQHLLGALTEQLTLTQDEFCGVPL